MKNLVTASFAVLIAAVAGTAFASTPSGGLSRAEVRAQLVQAERDGQIPTSDVAYPPSAEQIKQNATIYKAQFGKSEEPQQWLAKHG